MTNLQLKEILENGIIGRLVINDIQFPYVVSMNYGYDDEYIYLHSSKKGRKIELLSQNNNVTFQIDYYLNLIKNDLSCNWNIKGRSLVIKNQIEFVENNQEKIYALKKIMNNYDTEKEYSFNDNSVKEVGIFKIKIDNYTIKESGF